jgi:hypothetical protein
MTTTETHAITTFDKRRGSGWPSAMHVVALGGGDLLIHSPTWIDEATFTRIEQLGKPRILFAPNHYHHLSLRRYRERFPKAEAVATPSAIPRLRSLGHDGLASTADVALPRSMRWVLPEGTKTGEGWIAIDGKDGPSWIVCDAFFNETTPVRGLEGAFLRLAKISPGLCVGATFKLLGIADKARYKAWVVEALEREQPDRIVFSHGDAIERGGAKLLADILSARV